MRRFFVEEIRADQEFLDITGPEARHIANVLRMKKGDGLILADGKGVRFSCIIESVAHRRVKVLLRKPVPAPPPSPIKINLCQAVLKSKRMDFLVEKTSELGVDTIYPFCSERSVIRLGEARLQRKSAHWQEIARAVLKQADREKPAQIEPLLPFAELIRKWANRDAVKIVLWEGEESQDLKAVLDLTPATHEFVGVVGPEGGFEREEVDRAKEAGFVSASLGRRTLRAETAAITLVGVVQYQWGDLALRR